MPNFESNQSVNDHDHAPKGIHSSWKTPTKKPRIIDSSKSDDERNDPNYVFQSRAKSSITITKKNAAVADEVSIVKSHPRMSELGFEASTPNLSISPLCFGPKSNRASDDQTMLNMPIVNQKFSLEIFSKVLKKILYPDKRPFSV